MPRSEDFEYGYVVGIFIDSEMDSPTDSDRLPDARPAGGMTPTLTRKHGQYKHPLAAPDNGAMGMFINPRPIRTAIMPDGHMTSDLTSDGRVAPAAQPGVWLPVGIYIVEPGEGWEPWEIEVTSAHTQEDPLDLFSESPWEPPIGVTLQMAQLPSSGEGFLRRLPDGSLMWDMEIQVVDVSGLRGELDAILQRLDVLEG